MSVSRILLCIVAVFGLSVASASAVSSSEHFRFARFNPPTLSTSCVVGGTGRAHARVYVRTNTCTALTISHDRYFRRLERDCNGRPRVPYYYDTVPARFAFSYGGIVERPCHGPNTPGHHMRYTYRGGNGNASRINRYWHVETHRGGYMVTFFLSPATAFSCDDDAGYYTANASVYVSTLPIRDAVQPNAICLTRP